MVFWFSVLLLGWGGGGFFFTLSFSSAVAYSFQKDCSKLDF